MTLARVLSVLLILAFVLFSPGSHAQRVTSWNVTDVAGHARLELVGVWHVGCAPIAAFTRNGRAINVQLTNRSGSVCDASPTGFEEQLDLGPIPRGIYNVVVVRSDINRLITQFDFFWQATPVPSIDSRGLIFLTLLVSILALLNVRNQR